MDINNLSLSDKPKSRDVLDIWFFVTAKGHSIKEVFHMLRKLNRTIPYDHIRYQLLERAVSNNEEDLALLASTDQSIESIRTDLRRLVSEMEIGLAAKAAAANRQIGEFTRADVGESSELLSYSASVWSSPTKRNDPSMLPARLTNAFFLDLLDLSLRHGTDRVYDALESIKDEMQQVQYRIEREMLDNIIKGFANTAHK